MSRPLTPSVNVICISQDGLNFVDEFEDLIDDFDRSPRPDANQLLSSDSLPEELSARRVEFDAKSNHEEHELLSLQPDDTESGSPHENVTILECNLLLSPGPTQIEPRSLSASSKRPLTAAYASPAYTPFPSRPSTTSSNNDDSLFGLSRQSTKSSKNFEEFFSANRLSSTSSLNEDSSLPPMRNTTRIKQTYDPLPTNEFVESDFKSFNKQARLSTFIEMAIMKSTSESRKIADETLEEIDKQNDKHHLVGVNYLVKWKNISFYPCLVVALLGIVIAFLGSSVHVIREGFVGIYFLNGALMDTYTMPGIHFCIPFVTRIEKVEVRLSTENVPPLQVSTNDGITANFNDIQVLVEIDKDSVLSLVKRYGLIFKETLIHHRISEELRIYCANRSVDEIFVRKYSELVPTIREGLERRLYQLNVSDHVQVQHLTIPKPDVPENIVEQYHNLQVQWMDQIYEFQKQATEAIKKETENLGAKSDAEIRKAISVIKTEKAMLQKFGDKKISNLNDIIVRAREENLGQIVKYRKLKEAESNKLLFGNPAYIDLITSKAMAAESKVYFSGQESVLGALLQDIMDA